MIPPILRIAGASSSGKTTLLERLIPALSEGGRRVGVIKRSHGGLDLGAGGKDSRRAAAAGACPAIAIGSNGLTVEGRVTASLPDLAWTYCAGCDIVLVEGDRHSVHDKILVVGGRNRDKPLDPVESVGLVVSDHAGSPAGAIGRDDIAGIASWIRGWAALRRRRARGVIGAILVGGKSRRMGFDKIAMRIDGEPVLSRLADILADRVEGVFAIGRAPRRVEAPRFVQWHLDLRPGLGPLSGIATALALAGAGGSTAGRAVLALACDMPRVSPGLLDRLLDGRRADRPVSAIRHPLTGRLEPLAAIYEASALPAIEEALDRGALSATKVLEAVGAHAVDVPAEFSAHIAGANTPEELQGM